MRRLLFGIVGVILCAVGAIWIGQGSGAVHGSPMTGHSQWIYLGIVLVVAGVASILAGAYWARRQR